MDSKGIQSVVVTEDGFDFPTSQVGNQTGGDADDDSAIGSDKAAGGSNDDQSSDGTRTEAEDAGLAAGYVLSHGPNEGGGGSSQGRGGKGVGGDHISGNGAAGVESVPSDPQHAGADHAQNHIVRRHRFLAEADSFAKDQTED